MLFVHSAWAPVGLQWYGRRNASARMVRGGRVFHQAAVDNEEVRARLDRIQFVEGSIDAIPATLGMSLCNIHRASV